MLSPLLHQPIHSGSFRRIGIVIMIFSLSPVHSLKKFSGSLASTWSCFRTSVLFEQGVPQYDHHRSPFSLNNVSSSILLPVSWHTIEYQNACPHICGSPWIGSCCSLGPSISAKKPGNLAGNQQCCLCFAFPLCSLVWGAEQLREKLTITQEKAWSGTQKVGWKSWFIMKNIHKGKRSNIKKEIWIIPPH